MSEPSVIEEGRREAALRRACVPVTAIFTIKGRGTILVVDLTGIAAAVKLGDYLRVPNQDHWFRIVGVESHPRGKTPSKEMGLCVTPVRGEGPIGSYIKVHTPTGFLEEVAEYEE